MNDEILKIIGAKEVEIYQLQKQVYEMNMKNKELMKEIEMLKKEK